MNPPWGAGGRYLYKVHTKIDPLSAPFETLVSYYYRCTRRAKAKPPAGGDFDNGSHNTKKTQILAR